VGRRDRQDDHLAHPGFRTVSLPELWVTITPGQSDGTEYPAALQLGDANRRDLPALVAHEISHQWFYSLVGNNQAEHPWLDESLATFGESIASGDEKAYRSRDISRRVVGLMGKPMIYWADNGGYDRYTEGVYNQGAAVLLQARRQVGAGRFDTALRSYIGANAHRVATPAEFAHAFAGRCTCRGIHLSWTCRGAPRGGDAPGIRR
jgi:hypothetical protein